MATGRELNSEMLFYRNAWWLPRQARSTHVCLGRHNEARGSPVFRAAPLRAQSHRGPGGPVREEQVASRVHRGNDDEALRRAA